MKQFYADPIPALFPQTPHDDADVRNVEVIELYQASRLQGMIGEKPYSLIAHVDYRTRGLNLVKDFTTAFHASEYLEGHLSSLACSPVLPVFSASRHLFHLLRFLGLRLLATLPPIVRVFLVASRRTRAAVVSLHKIE